MCAKRQQTDAVQSSCGVTPGEEKGSGVVRALGVAANTSKCAHQCYTENRESVAELGREVTGKLQGLCNCT